MALFPLSGRKRPTCGHPKGEAGWLSIAGDPIAKSALYVNFQLSPVRSIVRLRGIVAPATSDSEGVTLRAEQANQHAVFWPRPHAAPAPSSALRAQHRPQRVEVNAARSGPPATGEGTEGLKGRAGGAATLDGRRLPSTRGRAAGPEGDERRRRGGPVRLRRPLRTAVQSGSAPAESSARRSGSRGADSLGPGGTASGDPRKRVLRAVWLQCFRAPQFRVTRGCTGARL